MCGLAGVILKERARHEGSLAEIKRGFQNVLTSANDRGGHATGFAEITKSGEYQLVKLALPAKLFFDSEDVVKTMRGIDKTSTILMGHTRYATQGSPLWSPNNHPIRAGHVIGTHNGWVSNDDELFDRFSLSRFAEVDSEVIFRMADTSKSVDEFINERFTKIRGKASIVWCDLERPEYVYLLKGNNPLSMAYHKRLNLIVYGSTWEIVKSSFDENELSRMKIKENRMIRINTKTFKMVTTKVHWKPSELDAHLSRAPKVSGKYANTVRGFVPRYSYGDSYRQENIFGNVVATDGSTIKKVKGS